MKTLTRVPAWTRTLVPCVVAVALIATMNVRVHAGDLGDVDCGSAWAAGALFASPYRTPAWGYGGGVVGAPPLVGVAPWGLQPGYSSPYIPPAPPRASGLAEAEPLMDEYIAEQRAQLDAQALRAENAELRRRIEDLERAIDGKSRRRKPRPSTRR